MAKTTSPSEHECDRMKLWNAVCETNPAITKKVNQRGGFTAICAQAQHKAATRLWGPYGTTWGVKNLEWHVVKDGEKIVETVLAGVFWYPGGEFPISTDMVYKPGNDTRKKLLTDLKTKALSLLGFNSDVFEGKFDDSKYVEDMRKKYGDGNGKPANRPKAQPPPETQPEAAKPARGADPLATTSDNKKDPNRLATPDDLGAFMNVYVTAPRKFLCAKTPDAIPNKQFAQMLAAQVCGVDDSSTLTAGNLNDMVKALRDGRVNMTTGELFTEEECNGVVQ